jgi:tetratricopeptide (TPR) repeat protein
MIRNASPAKGSAAFLLVIFLLATCASFMALKVKTDTIVRKRVPGSSIIYIPSGKFLRYATFGYSALTADAIYLWAIQYYSTPTIDDRFNYLDHIFAIISDLDPTYTDPYETGALIASAEAGDTSLAFKILDNGAAKNPGQWLFPFEAGHIAMMNLKNYDLAIQYFKKCMDLPGAPDFTKRLFANALYKRGDNETSWQTWLEIYNTAPDERTKKIASNHLYQVKSAMDTGRLKVAVGKFRERYGRFPAELEDLVRSRLLEKLPKDLDGQDYVYDPKSGDVKAATTPWKR